MFRIVTASLVNYSLGKKEVFLLINFSLKSNLSDFRIAMPACLLVPSDWKEYFHPHFYSKAGPIFRTNLSFL